MHGYVIVGYGMVFARFSDKGEPIWIASLDDRLRPAVYNLEEGREQKLFMLRRGFEVQLHVLEVREDPC